MVVYAELAQLGEHLPYKQEVIGSSPIFCIVCSSIGRAVACGATGCGFKPRHAPYMAPWSKGYDTSLSSW